MSASEVHNNRFILAEPFSGPGAEAEERVWDVVRRAFRSRDAIGYSRYPLFSRVGERRKEPDVLIADSELGIIVIEVKGVRIRDIEAINGPVWFFRPGFYTDKASPYRQAEDHLWAILGRLDVERELRGGVAGRALIALPYVTRSEWRERGFDQNPSSPPILFADDLTPKRLMEILEGTAALKRGDRLYGDKLSLLFSALGHSAMFRPEPKESNASEKTRGWIIAQARSRLTELDLQQQRIGKQIPPGPQRIRGIAGSGKTVLLAQKAAAMHLRHPDWDIAFVFFTRSLYQHVRELVDRWLKTFSNGDVQYTAEVSRKLRVLHAWGAQEQEGFYRTVAIRSGQKPLGVVHSKQAGYDFGAGLAWCCKQLLDRGRVPPLFDAVLIDEGQDLIVDDPVLLHRGRQPFYWLAHSTLRPVSKDSVERRLVWAYDEAQSLDSLKIPTAGDLFGPDQAKLVAGAHTGGILKSEVMHRCYRTPAKILVAAHALGMGLLRPGGPIASISTADGWRAIGYEVDGDFRRADEIITLTRPLENSPCPIVEDAADSPIRFTVFPSRTGKSGELEALSEKVRDAIKHDGIAPHDILVVVPNIPDEGRRLIREIGEALRRVRVDYFVASAPARNVFHWESQDTQPNQFSEPGCVTLSTVHRAKGNEADLVFVVAVDQLGDYEEKLSAPPLFADVRQAQRTEEERFRELARLRNSLFVSLSRSRGWVELSAVGEFPLHNEIREVLASGTTVRFRNRVARRSLEA